MTDSKCWGNSYRPRIWYAPKQIFKIKGYIKRIPEKQKQRWSVATRKVLRDIVMEVLQAEMRGHQTNSKLHEEM